LYDSHILNLSCVMNVVVMIWCLS